MSAYQRDQIVDMLWNVRRFGALERIHCETQGVTKIASPPAFERSGEAEESFSTKYDLEPHELFFKDMSLWIGSAQIRGKISGEIAEKLGAVTKYSGNINKSVDNASGGFMMRYVDGKLRSRLSLDRIYDSYNSIRITPEGTRQKGDIGTFSNRVIINILDLYMDNISSDQTISFKGHQDYEHSDGALLGKCHVNWEVTATPAPIIKFIDIWLNAFIPKHVAGVTRPRPNHPDETMLSGLPLSDCFLSDQREFDSSPTASSRMHQRIRIDLVNNEVLAWRRCDPTISVDRKSGAKIAEKSADTSRTIVEVMSSDDGIPRDIKWEGTSPLKPIEIKIRVKGEGNNPLLFATEIAGDVDWEGEWTVRVDPKLISATVEFDGLIDESPAFEAYVSVSDDGANAVPVFLELPPEGATPALNLPGKANRPIKARATIMPEAL